MPPVPPFPPGAPPFSPLPPPPLHPPLPPLSPSPPAPPPGPPQLRLAFVGCTPNMVRVGSIDIEVCKMPRVCPAYMPRACPAYAPREQQELPVPRSPLPACIWGSRRRHSYGVALHNVPRSGTIAGKSS
eukprot:1213914-Prymnesium_polylepis.1